MQAQQLLKGISHRYVGGTRESERERYRKRKQENVEISNAFLSGKHGM